MIVPGGGEGVFPCHRLMGMCRWIGSHFHGWIDCYYLSVMGCISITVTDTVTIIGSRIFRISFFFFWGGGENSGKKGFKNEDPFCNFLHSSTSIFAHNLMITH